MVPWIAYDNTVNKGNRIVATTGTKTSKPELDFGSSVHIHVNITPTRQTVDISGKDFQKNLTIFDCVSFSIIKLHNLG